MRAHTSRAKAFTSEQRGWTKRAEYRGKPATDMEALCSECGCWAPMADGTSLHPHRVILTREGERHEIPCQGASPEEGRRPSLRGQGLTDRQRRWWEKTLDNPNGWSATHHLVMRAVETLAERGLVTFEVRYVRDTKRADGRRPYYWVKPGGLTQGTDVHRVTP